MPRFCKAPIQDDTSLGQGYPSLMMRAAVGVVAIARAPQASFQPTPFERTGIGLHIGGSQTPVTIPLAQQPIPTGKAIPALQGQMEAKIADETEVAQRASEACDKDRSVR